MTMFLSKFQTLLDPHSHQAIQGFTSPPSSVTHPSVKARNKYTEGGKLNDRYKIKPDE
jgi:hypothetical protein